MSLEMIHTAVPMNFWGMASGDRWSHLGKQVSILAGLRAWTQPVGVTSCGDTCTSQNHTLFCGGFASLSQCSELEPSKCDQGRKKIVSVRDMKQLSTRSVKITEQRKCDQGKEYCPGRSNMAQSQRFSSDSRGAKSVMVLFPNFVLPVTYNHMPSHTHTPHTHTHTHTCSPHACIHIQHTYSEMPVVLWKKSGKLRQGQRGRRVREGRAPLAQNFSQFHYKTVPFPDTWDERFEYKV